MQHKRLLISALLLLGLGLTGLQAQTLYVKQTNGTQTAYALNIIRKLTLTSANVTIQKTDNTTADYAFNALKYFSYIDYTTGINEPKIHFSNTFLAYPNPVTDILNIDLTDTKNENGCISILTLDGKEMLKHETNGAGIVTINMSLLPQGIYLCRFYNKTEIKTIKIIKQ